jgi:hypothetical protein
MIRFTAPATLPLLGCVVPTLRRRQKPLAVPTVTVTFFVVQRLQTICKAAPKTRDVLSQNTADLNE